MFSLIFTEVEVFLHLLNFLTSYLTENGFMDNVLSLKYLESDEGEKAIVALHVEGIINYINLRKDKPL